MSARPIPAEPRAANPSPARDRAALRRALDLRTDAAEVEPILHREFWRAPTRSPLRLVFTSSER